jgi:hypothetical protein
LFLVKSDWGGCCIAGRQQAGDKELREQEDDNCAQAELYGRSLDSFASIRQVRDKLNAREEVSPRINPSEIPL